MPLVAVVVLSAIHARLGAELIARNAIWSALALMQIAACGLAIGYLQGHEIDAFRSFVWAAVLAVAAAVVFAIPGVRRLPHDVAGAIVYPAAAGASMLILSRAPDGPDRLQEILAGNMLALSWRTLIGATIVFALVAFAVRRRSSDLNFFVPAAIAFAASTAIAGVLVTFAFTIIPTIAGRRFAYAWPIGAIVSAITIVMAYETDLPVGGTIMCALVIALLVASGLRAKYFGR